MCRAFSEFGSVGEFRLLLGFPALPRLVLCHGVERGAHHSGRGRVQRSYLPTPGTAATWAAAVAGAEQLLLQPDPQARAAEAEALSAEIVVSLRKERKRKLSWEQPVLKAGMEEVKRRRLELEAKENTEKDAGKEVADKAGVTAGGTSRQRDLAVSKQEKERQEKEKGPGW